MTMSHETELAPCPWCARRLGDICYLCANGDAEATGVIPRSMAVEIALGAQDITFILMIERHKIRANHGLYHRLVDVRRAP